MAIYLQITLTGDLRSVRVRGLETGTINLVIASEARRSTCKPPLRLCLRSKVRRSAPNAIIASFFCACAREAWYGDPPVTSCQTS